MRDLNHLQSQQHNGLKCGDNALNVAFEFLTDCNMTDEKKKKKVLYVVGQLQLFTTSKVRSDAFVCFPTYALFIAKHLM